MAGMTHSKQLLAGVRATVYPSQTVAPRAAAVLVLYFLMGCLAVPVGGIANLVVVHGGFTPLVPMPPPPSQAHMITAVVLYAALRLTLRTRMAGAVAMAVGFTLMANSEALVQQNFPHFWMAIYAIVDTLC